MILYCIYFTHLPFQDLPSPTVGVKNVGGGGLLCSYFLTFGKLDRGIKCYRSPNSLCEHFGRKLIPAPPDLNHMLGALTDPQSCMLVLNLLHMC